MVNSDKMWLIVVNIIFYWLNNLISQLLKLRLIVKCVVVVNSGQMLLIVVNSV